MLRNGAATKGALAARLPIYPRYVFEDGWLDDAVRPAVLRAMDADGLASGRPLVIWHAGSDTAEHQQ